MPVDAPQLLAIPVPQATTDSSLGTSQCGEGILPDLTSETLLSRSLSTPPPTAAPGSCSEVPDWEHPVLHAAFSIGRSSGRPTAGTVCQTLGLWGAMMCPQEVSAGLAEPPH